MSLLPFLLFTAVLGGCEGDEGRSKNFDGPWARHAIDDSFRGADGVRLRDINDDGLPDVVTGWEEAGVARAYLHPGFGEVRAPWPAVTVGETPQVEDAVWVDLDGNGHYDVVSSLEGKAQAVVVSFAPDDSADFFDPDAWRTEAIPSTLGRRWMYAVPMDVDGRFGVDLVIGGKLKGGMVAWLESPPNPLDLDEWKLHPISPAGWVMSLHAIDMNVDGLSDILVSDRTNGVYWLEQPLDPDSRSQNWTPHPVTTETRSPAFVAPVFDAEDGIRKVVVPSGSADLELFEREDVSAQLWSRHRITYPPGLGSPKAVAVGDIDLDVMTTEEIHGFGVIWYENPLLSPDPE